MKSKALDAARLLGRRGGLARAARLTPEQRSDIAKKAGKARVKKLTPEQRKQIATLGALSRWGKKKQ